VLFHGGLPGRPARGAPSVYCNAIGAVIVPLPPAGGRQGTT